MSSRIALPGEDQVRSAVAEVIDQARDNGRRPTVIAVARTLGLDNATLRRHFPHVVTELRSHGPSAEPAVDKPSRFERLQEAHARLKQDHARLVEELHAAQAVIQRLALENHHLRKQGEDSATIVPLAAARIRRDEQDG